MDLRAIVYTVFGICFAFLVTTFLSFFIEKGYIPIAFVGSLVVGWAICLVLEHFNY